MNRILIFPECSVSPGAQIKRVRGLRGGGQTPFNPQDFIFFKIHIIVINGSAHMSPILRSIKFFLYLSP